MRQQRILVLTAAFAGLAWAAWAVLPSDGILKSTLAGASGTASADSLALMGSVGQPTTGSSTAGGLEVHSGFWPGVTRDLATAVDAAPVRPGIHLDPPQPNPFNPRTTLAFELERPTSVRLIVHDVRGRRVRVLADGEFDRGRHEVTWNGVADDGSAVASGVYYALLVSDLATRTRKLTLYK